MQFQNAAEGFGFFGVLHRFGKAGCGLCQILPDQDVGVFRRGMSEDQNRHGDAVISKFKRFIKAADCEIVGTFLLEKVSNAQCAVPVGVCFHNTQKAASVRERLTNSVIIIADCAQIDFCPGAFCKIIHILTLIREDVSIIRIRMDAVNEGKQISSSYI